MTWAETTQKRRKAGLCITCGLNPPINPTKPDSRCRSCLDRHYELNKHTLREVRQRHLAKLRKKCIDHYGGKCICCGETNEVFLEFDHIENDGSKHKKKHGYARLFIWLARNNFPEDYAIQLLCANCHTAKTKLGFCPFHPKSQEHRLDME